MVIRHAGGLRVAGVTSTDPRHRLGRAAEDLAAAHLERLGYEIVARRPGDVAEVYADPALAKRLLGWQAEFDVDAMCRDAWRWQSMNPDGYAA